MKIEKSMPNHYNNKRLGDHCEIILGQSPPSDTYNSEGIGLPFFQGKAEFGDLHPIAIKWCSMPGKIALPNDILISVRAPVGSTNIADHKCCIGRGLAAIRHKNYKYVYYFLKSIETKINELGTGTTFKAITGTTLKDIIIPVPPDNEQNLIVEKIEELFSELDTGGRLLETLKEQMKTYWQAVLKWAFEGRLTNENVKKGHLPEGWKWISFGEMTNNYDGKRIPLSRHMRANRKGEFRYYGATGVVDYVNDYIFNGKYILIGEDGANLLSKSRSLAFLVNGKFWVNNHAHVVQCKPGFSLEYLCYYFNSLDLSTFITGSAQPKLTQANLNCIQVCVPSINEQEDIVRQIESRLCECDKLAETIKLTLNHVEGLKQSILQQAFEGKLIKPQTN